MNLNRSPEKETGFFNGRGFYIVLILCVAVIGVSGFVLSRSAANVPEIGPLPVITPAADDSPQPTAGVGQTVTNMPRATGTAKPTAKPTVPATVPPTVSASPTETALFFMRPVSGEVIASFSGDTLVYSSTLNDWRVHAGIDVAADLGTQVRAAAKGTVVSVSADALFGTVVEIAHANGYVTRYAGLQEQPCVSPGDAVDAGQVVGGVGATALCETVDPVHLHFEVWKNGKAVDPESVLPKSAN